MMFDQLFELEPMFYPILFIIIGPCWPSFLNTQRWLQVQMFLVSRSADAEPCQPIETCSILFLSHCPSCFVAMLRTYLRRPSQECKKHANMHPWLYVALLESIWVCWFVPEQERASLC